MKPMTRIECWALVYPDGRWFVDKPIADKGAAQRAADVWNSNLPRGERDRLRVARIQIEEIPVPAADTGELKRFAVARAYKHRRESEETR